MGYKEDAQSLVAECASALVGIRKEYDASLHDKNIHPALLIRIKNFMENLRSALDFIAHDLFDKYGAQSSQANIYFPYAWEGLDLAGFRQKQRIEKCIPGLSNNRPDIVAVIESYQHFSDSKNAWLPKFMELNNENKHQGLTPQIRKERKELRLSSGGTSMSIGQGASISIGHGASITLGGGMVIPGGQHFDVNNPPQTMGQGTKEIITWVAFHFSSNDEPVIPFLERTMHGVEEIVNELSAK